MRRVSWIKAALLAWYQYVSWSFSEIPSTEENLTTFASRVLVPATSSGLSRWVRKNVRTLRSITLFQPDSGKESNAASQAVPALSTRTSKRDSRSDYCETRSRMPSSFETSPGSAKQSPTCDSSSAVARAISALRAVM